MRCAMTFLAPRTRKVLPPNSSFKRAFMRSLMVRPLKRSSCAGVSCGIVPAGKRAVAFLLARRPWRAVMGTSQRSCDCFAAMPELSAVRVDLFCVIGAVGKFVKIIHSLRGQGHQRYGRLRVMHAGAGEQRSNDNLSVGDIEMDFVTASAVVVFASRASSPGAAFCAPL